MSSECETVCNVRTCTCPAQPDDRTREPSELAYIEAERKGLRLDSRCPDCPSPVACVERGMACEPHLPGWLRR